MKTTTLSKFCTVGMVIALLFVSCKKKDAETTQGFRASIESNEDDSKTSLQGLNVYWTEDDLICVANASGSNLVFQLTEGKDTQNGVFYSGGGSTYDFTGPFKAVYPATNPQNVTNSISNTEATINLPSEQAITYTGTFGNGCNPMVAYSTNQTLQFRNVLGGMCFIFNGNNDTYHVTKVVLTSTNTSEKLWGTATVECNPSAANYLVLNQSDITNTASNKHQLTLNCDITVPANQEHEFYFMLPPGTLSTGMEVEVFDGSTSIYHASKTWESSSDIIQRNHLRKIAQSLEIGVAPSVATNAYSLLRSVSVTLSGNVTSTGGATVVERGFCLSTSPAPTINDTKIVVGSGSGSYNINYTSLAPVTTYYVRAYATNGAGTSYGEEKSFTTPVDGFTANSSGLKVYLAPGNLQWLGAATAPAIPHCRFALHQYDIISTSTGPNSTTQNSDARYANRDLFGWGTSGQNSTAPFPWTISKSDSDYPHGSDIAGTNLDWGVYHYVENNSNGNMQERDWRTPTKDELDYILFDRNASTINGTANARFAKATVNNHKGLIIFPDHFTHPTGITQPAQINNATADFVSNNYTDAQWTSMQNNGAVFLPCADYRDGAALGTLNSYGVYWTSSYAGSSGSEYKAYRLDFDGAHVVIDNANTHHGLCVRLVMNEDRWITNNHIQ